MRSAHSWRGQRQEGKRTPAVQLQDKGQWLPLHNVRRPRGQDRTEARAGGLRGGRLWREWPQFIIKGTSRDPWFKPCSPKESFACYYACNVAEPQFFHLSSGDRDDCCQYSLCFLPARRSFSFLTVLASEGRRENEIRRGSEKAGSRIPGPRKPPGNGSLLSALRPRSCVTLSKSHHLSEHQCVLQFGHPPRLDRGVEGRCLS